MIQASLEVFILQWKSRKRPEFRYHDLWSDKKLRSILFKETYVQSYRYLIYSKQHILTGLFTHFQIWINAPIFGFSNERPIKIQLQNTRVQQKIFRWNLNIFFEMTARRRQILSLFSLLSCHRQMLISTKKKFWFHQKCYCFSLAFFYFILIGLLLVKTNR